MDVAVAKSDDLFLWTARDLSDFRGATSLSQTFGSASKKVVRVWSSDFDAVAVAKR